MYKTKKSKTLSFNSLEQWFSNGAKWVRRNDAHKINVSSRQMIISRFHVLCTYCIRIFMLNFALKFELAEHFSNHPPRTRFIKRSQIPKA